MLCSPAEIEKKRQEALQKLAKRNNSLIIAGGSSLQSDQNSNNNQATSSSPLKSPWKSFLMKKPYDKISSPACKTDSKLKNVVNSDNKVVVTINFVSPEKFCIKMSLYYSPVIEMLKTVPSKNYDPKTRIWSYHIKDFDDVTSKLNLLRRQNVIVEQPPRFVINCFKHSDPICDIDSSRIDPVLFQTLLPFQLEGLRFGVKRSGRCLIADDMGLGKTFQALGIMNYYKSDWPLLIVTNASMKNVWEETILNYLPSVSFLQVQYMISGKDYIGNSLILIVSHDLMSRCCDKLLERNFGCIIIDESHNLKNYKAKMTQAAIKLCKRAKRVVLLSGTPALSRPKELYSQLSLIDESFFGSFIEYAKRYCDLQKTNFGLDSSGKSNLQELEILLNIKFMIRRRKEDVLASLPNKSHEVVKLDVNLNDIDAANKNFLEVLSSQFTRTRKAVEKQAVLLKFFCETAKIKIPAVCGHVTQLLESKKKFLVFAHHRVMLDALEKVLNIKNFKYIRIDGSTSGDRRKYFVDKFQTDENCVCALLSIKAANAGITLTAAQHVVFAELHWNPSILSQAEARVHRIGQENTVLIQYLLADGTADDHMWPLLQEKHNILREMGLTKDTFLNVQQSHKSTQNNAFENTLFEKNSKCETSEVQMDEDDILCDGLDDILCSIDI